MIKRFILLSYLVIACALTPAKAQNSFPYPTLPDTLRSVELRAAYLSEHYWDNFNFADTLELNNKEMAEQGFVNFIDILSRFNQQIAQKGIAGFTAKAFIQKPSKERFESLIEHYYENPESPMRNDRIYSLFLEDMAKSPYFDETEKERLNFKLKQARKNLPGTTAIDISFTQENGKTCKLSEYKEKKVILYFHDPECENCHKVSAWLKKQEIPADIEVIRIVADNRISAIYGLKAMPTIYLLDKGNKVILKDCTPEQLIETVQQK